MPRTTYAAKSNVSQRTTIVPRQTPWYTVAQYPQPLHSKGEGEDARDTIETSVTHAENTQGYEQLPMLSVQSFELRLTRKSRVSSKLSQLLAMLGATLSRFGTMPLYSPRTPSWDTIIVTASHIDLY